MSEYEDQAQTPTEENHVSECIKAVDDYRGQNISKWEAVSQILSSIRSTTASTDIDQRATAGGTYLAMLNEHDQALINAGSRGLQGLEQNRNENNVQEEEDVDGEVGSKHSQFSRSCSPSSKRPKFSDDHPTDIDGFVPQSSGVNWNKCERPGRIPLYSTII